MKKLLVLAVLVAACTLRDPRARADYKATAADLANCSQWHETPIQPQWQQCKNDLQTMPPPSAGTPCGTTWDKTERPEGSWWRRMVWHINGHYSERPSPGVCR